MISRCQWQNEEVSGEQNKPNIYLSNEDTNAKAFLNRLVYAVLALSLHVRLMLVRCLCGCCENSTVCLSDGLLGRGRAIVESREELLWRGRKHGTEGILS